MDVILPFGNCPEQPERQANLVRTLQGFLADVGYSGMRIIVAELGGETSQRGLAQDLGVEYVFTGDRGEFSPGRAMNAGFMRREDPSELVYFHQIDFVVPPDVLTRAVARRQELDCPFVYPYWGEIDLSRPVSAAVRAGSVSGVALVSAFQLCIERWSEEHAGAQAPGEASGHVEIRPTDRGLASVVACLPPELTDALAGSTHDQLWGCDDRDYALYAWRPDGSQGAWICRVSGGPRASGRCRCGPAAEPTPGRCLSFRISEVRPSRSILALR